jgi:hypothetical protein
LRVLWPLCILERRSTPAQCRQTEPLGRHALLYEGERLIFVEECLCDCLLWHHSHALRSQKLIARKIAMHPKTMSIWRGVVFMPLEYPLWLGMSV